MAAERLDGPSVLALVGNMTGPTLWRILQPFRALQARGYSCEWEHSTAPVVGPLTRRMDAVLLPRLSWPPESHKLASRWVDEHKAAGRLVLYDCDDDLFTYGAMQWQREVWERGETLEQLDAERYERIWALTVADGVTVSTVPLARIVASYTDRPVIVLPNAIDVPWFRSVFRASRRQISGTTIGWAGGQRSDRDLGVVGTAWARIAERFPAVRFVVYGWPAPPLVAAVPSERLCVIPWQSIERYPVGLVEIDVACCSVEADRWNENKSPIKAMEAALAGSAVVATPTVYGGLVEHGVNGFLAETTDEWEAALVALVGRPSLRAMLARRLLRHVERRCSLSENLWRWPDAWSAIAEDARSRRERLVTA
jgi:glycosyltransferase involved in cell wall biosynthesis